MTITASEALVFPRHSGASSSSQHSAASRVADRDSVVGRTSIKETCADMHRETVVSSLFGSVSKVKRDRQLNVV